MPNYKNKGQLVLLETYKDASTWTTKTFTGPWDMKNHYSELILKFNIKARLAQDKINEEKNAPTFTTLQVQQDFETFIRKANVMVNELAKWKAFTTDPSKYVNYNPKWTTAQKLHARNQYKGIYNNKVLPYYSFLRNNKLNPNKLIRNYSSQQYQFRIFKTI